MNRKAVKKKNFFLSGSYISRKLERKINSTLSLSLNSTINLLNGMKGKGGQKKGMLLAIGGAVEVSAELLPAGWFSPPPPTTDSKLMSL